MWSIKLHYKFIESTKNGDFMLALDAERLLRRMASQMHTNNHNPEGLKNSGSLATWLCKKCLSYVSAARKTQEGVCGPRLNHIFKSVMNDLVTSGDFSAFLFTYGTYVRLHMHLKW